jgi:dienelactone hydrolase
MPDRTGRTPLGITVTRLQLAAAAVIAAHVVDDSFVQPQPGTSAADHLVSGLVPLLALGAAAAAAMRFRRGMAAAIALVVGVFGIAAGVEAVHYTRASGLSGDDYTGFLALGAGLVSLAVGAATLWRTRRLDDSRRRRYLRRALIAVAGFVVAFQLVLPVALSYGFTHVARAVVPAADLRAPYEEVTFRSTDGLRLHGWYVPSRNGAAVIAFPGRKGPQRPARILARHGYGVLLFDRRGEGESEGDPNALGWAGDRDLKGALAFLRTRPDVEPGRIGGLGLSVGGELLLETAAETDELAAVVSEGAGIRSVREQLELSGVTRWLAAPQWAAITAATAVFSNHTPPPNLKGMVGRIAPRPVLLVYATHGQGGEELNPTYRDAAGPSATIWEIPDARHTGGIEARPAEYERRVIAFFDGALLG